MILVAWLGISPPVKQEREARIQRDAFPAPAVEWLYPVIDRAGRVRYYRQTDGADLTFEVKFRISGESWSVEFLEDGSFDEAERLIRQRELPEAVVRHLDSRFRSWKTTRIQASHQPVWGRTASPEWFRNPTAPVGYELEVDGTNGAEIGRFELTFDAAGTFLEERRVVEIPMDF